MCAAATKLRAAVLIHSTGHAGRLLHLAAFSIIALVHSHVQPLCRLVWQQCVTRKECWLMSGVVLAVSRSPTHTFSKPNHTSIRLLAGLGVEGDAHMGRTVKHRSRVAADPTQPNLRQVHLIHAELHDELQLHSSPLSSCWALRDCRSRPNQRRATLSAADRGRHARRSIPG